MKRAALAMLSALAMVALAAAGDQPKPRRPRFDVRVLPRMALSRESVFFTAELQGGDDLEEYYCPEIEWDWGDGGKSLHGADCPPFEAGSRIERRFTAEHVFTRAATFNVKVILRHASRTLAAVSIRIPVRPGFGDSR